LKALITGGTGFVGSHIARLLIENGHTARILHRTTSRLDALQGLNHESAIGDILDENSVRQACQGCDWVFHVAAVADYWRSDAQRMIEANVEGTRRVLGAARESGVKRVVVTSSGAALGMRDDGHPASEADNFNLKPERFPYGYSKAQAEGVACEAAQSGQDIVIVNPVVVMGPGDLNLISGNFVLRIKQLGWLVPVTSGGVAVTDVRDIARWHLAAAEHGRSGERYILGTANYEYRDWFALIADVVGRRQPFIKTPDFVLPPLAALIDLARRLEISTPIDANQIRLGARDVFFEFDKAWNAFGPPEISMRQSLEDTYHWYVEHGYIG